MAGRFPECIALRPDPELHRSRDGRTVLGGSPLRLVRFTDAAAGTVVGLLDGETIGGDRMRQAVAARLVDNGLAHPVPAATEGRSVTTVIPVRDHTDALGRLLDAMRDGFGGPLIVVDDGSRDPDAVAALVRGRGRLIRHETARGPGAARETGWSAAETPIVAFLDADVVPTAGWLESVMGHFTDPHVGMVAPRVRSRCSDTSVRARYERSASPLDLGPHPARVTPGGRVSYVPTAALACRRDVLDRLGGFDPALRVGEDVDLVWRAIEQGWTVRYEPDAVVEHEPRPSWTAWTRQRVTYGSAAAVLDQRHPGEVAPVRLDRWSLVAWALAVTGPIGSLAAVASTATATWRLRALLRDRVDRPTALAARLAAGGTFHSGLWLGRALWRAWLPPAVALALVNRRARRILAAAAVIPSLIEWRDRRPDLDPFRWIVVRAADDAAYGAGVWLGALRVRSWRCLLPRFTGADAVTGRRDRREPDHRAGTSDG